MKTSRIISLALVVLTVILVVPTIADESPALAQLVTKERVALNLAGAELILEAALPKA